MQTQHHSNNGVWYDWKNNVSEIHTCTASLFAKKEYMISECIQCTGYNMGISCVVLTTVHVYRTCIPWHNKVIIFYSIHMKQCTLRPSLRPYLGLNQGPSAHIDNSHPRSIATHRSTKAEAFAEQGEQLLQDLRASYVTNINANTYPLARTTLTS
jgi:hypothetical protein